MRDFGMFRFEWDIFLYIFVFKVFNWIYNIIIKKKEKMRKKREKF